SRLQDERQLHLPAAEEFADRLHTVEQDVVDDVERRITFEREFEILLQPDLLAVNDVLFQTLFDGQIRVGLLRLLRRNTFKQFRKLGQRIVGANVAVELAFVIDQLSGDSAFALVNAVERNDLARVDDGGIKSGCDRFVQEDGIEHDARHGRETKRYIRDAEDREAAGQFLLDAAQGGDGLGGVAPILFDASRDR